MSTMPATAPAEPDAQPTSPRRGGRRRLLLVLAAVVAIAGGGGAAWFLTADAGTAEEEQPAAEMEEGEILEVGTLTTNLAGDRPAYARVGVALVLAAGADPSVVDADLALVKDAAITEITRHRAEALQGEDGVAALRAGLTEAIGGLFEDGEVVRVVLTELLVQ